MGEPLIRPAGLEDIPDILELEKRAWGEEGAASEDMIRSRILTFPEGNTIALSENKIVGLLCTLLVKGYELSNTFRTWEEATASGYAKGLHNPDGETVYGVNLSVLPSYRDHNIGRMLVQKGIEILVVGAGRPMTVLGGRMNGFRRWLEEHGPCAPEEYLDRVVRGEIKDPSVCFFLSIQYRGVHYRAVRVLPGYFPDPDSLDNGVLLVWENKFLHDN